MLLFNIRGGEETGKKNGMKMHTRRGLTGVRMTNGHSHRMLWSEDCQAAAFKVANIDDS